MIEATEIRTPEELNQAIEGSNERPLLLFKHSTRCHISAAAYERFQRFLAVAPSDGPRAAVVLVVEHRAVSNAVSARLGVRHESPQALLVSDGKVVWHDSHDRIHEAALTQAIA